MPWGLGLPTNRLLYLREGRIRALHTRQPEGRCQEGVSHR